MKAGHTARLRHFNPKQERKHTMEQITLYYRESSSDKVYQASITPKDGGYIVHFAYGRRGATLQTGTKTQAPVPYDQAKRIYDKLVSEKTAKGYTPGEDGTPYQHTDKANEVSGINCQLLNPIEVSDVQRFIFDPAFCAQEKFDGKRILIRKEEAAIDGINRRGLVCGIPSVLVNEVRHIPGNCVIDGESVGEVFFAFDLLTLHGRDLRNQPYRDRLFALNQVISADFGFLKLADTALNLAEKAELLDKLRRENREGVVFKNLSAAYVAGRPASGGDNLKHKFYATASFIVNKVNGKRSVLLMLFDGHKVVPAGNVTIPPNHTIPVVGTVVEVRFLYAFRESGCIYQPVYLGVRTDITAEECTVAQLKYKAAEEEQAAA
jgi:bifunctional non-homologous end joining protein LigD